MRPNDLRLVFALVLLAAAAVAQPWPPGTSPAGLDTIEGNTSYTHWTSAGRRFQQVDFSQAGSLRVVSGLAWRRNGGTSQTTAGPRTFDLSIDLGHASFGALSGFLDDNYLPGTRTNVLPPTTISFPDWNANAGTPAPFDFPVATAPFVYDGVRSLVIDFSFTNNSPTGSVLTDRDFDGIISFPSGTSLGTGCTVTGETSSFTHAASFVNLGATPTPLFGMRLRLSGNNALPSSPLVAHLGFADPNIAGFLCGAIHALPGVTIPMRSTSTGSVPAVDFGFPHQPSLYNLSVYTQLFQLDAGQTPLPLAVSNGRQSTMPSTPVANAHRCAYAMYAIPVGGVTDPVSTMFIGGGMVIQLR